MADKLGVAGEKIEYHRLAFRFRRVIGIVAGGSASAAVINLSYQFVGDIVLIGDGTGPVLLIRPRTPNTSLFPAFYRNTHYFFSVLSLRCDFITSI